MEAEANGTAYAVLRALDQEGGLRFSLTYVSCSPLCDITDFGRTSSLVEELIKVASFRIMSPNHFSDIRLLVVYQDARNHHARDWGGSSVLVERFSKLEPYRSSCHTFDCFYWWSYGDSGCFALRPTTPQPDARLHRRLCPCSPQPLCGTLFFYPKLR